MIVCNNQPSYFMFLNGFFLFHLRICGIYIFDLIFDDGPLTIKFKVGTDNINMMQMLVQARILKALESHIHRIFVYVCLVTVVVDIVKVHHKQLSSHDM
mmetsp:Transcript_112727/g.158139  ORF Transcript_112727/g.158139 Transcript_112727/m.158139 type:complete len:99 (-) Transcript_112727:112-408(-)